MGKAYTCLPVITEAAYLLRRYPQFRDDLIRSVLVGEFSLLPIDGDEFATILQTFSTYDDQDIDFTDATLLHLANREKINVVFTLDRRHFNLLRKSDGSSLRLMPDEL